MKKGISTKTLVVCALAVSLVGAALAVVVEGTRANRGIVQLGIFPILLIILSALSLRGVRLPRVLVGISAIGVLCGAIVRYSDVGLVEGAFGVARFESDSLENTTRVFRDKVRLFMGERAVTKLGVIGTAVTDQVQARKALQEHPQLAGIVWGGEPWVNVSLPIAPPLSLASLPSNSFARKRLVELGVEDLQIISQVPWFALTRPLDPSTSEFLGRILRSIPAFPTELSGERESAELEAQLWIAGTIRAPWRTSEHLAVPRWMLGTLYLSRAVAGPEVSWGDLMCAEALFRTAGALTYRTAGKSALSAAIRNNTAVLRLLKERYSPNPLREFKAARKDLLRALSAKKTAGAANFEPQYWDPIALNLKALGTAIVVEERQRR